MVLNVANELCIYATLNSYVIMMMTMMILLLFLKKLDSMAQPSLMAARYVM